MTTHVVDFCSRGLLRFARIRSSPKSLQSASRQRWSLLHPWPRLISITNFLDFFLLSRLVLGAHASVFCPVAWQFAMASADGHRILHRWKPMPA